MMFNLEGMTALVTGASGGIGSSIARTLARQGARLAVATKYVQTAREHFAKKGVHVDLIKLYGSMELGPLVACPMPSSTSSAPAARCVPTTWSKSRKSCRSRRGSS